MTIDEARDQYGATHYAPMKDGVTPQMFYKRDWFCQFRREHKIWYYLSYANFWTGSDLGRTEKPEHLIAIPDMEDTDHANP